MQKFFSLFTECSTLPARNTLCQKSNFCLKSRFWQKTRLKIISIYKRKRLMEMRNWSNTLTIWVWSTISRWILDGRALILEKNRILWTVRFLTNEKFFKTRKFLKREQIWGLGDFSEMRDFSGLGELTNCGKKKTENIVTRSARLSLRLKMSHPI